MRRSESVFLLSSNTGLLVVLVTFTILFLTAVSVCGGHLCDFMASTTTFWSGRSVLMLRWSPGSIIFFVLIERSGIVAVLSGFALCSVVKDGVCCTLITALLS